MMIGNLFIDASLHNKYSAEDLTNAQFKFLTPNEGLDVSLTAETGKTYKFITIKLIRSHHKSR